MRIVSPNAPQGVPQDGIQQGPGHGGGLWENLKNELPFSPESDLFLTPFQVGGPEKGANNQFRNQVPVSALTSAAVNSMSAAQIVEQVKGRITPEKWSEIERTGFQGNGWPAPKPINMLTDNEARLMAQSLGIVTAFSRKRWVRVV